MKRRTMLSTVSMLGLALLAAGCAGTTVSAAAADAKDIADAAQAVAPQLLTFVANAATKAQVTSYIATIVKAASDVAAATTNASAPMVQQIIAAVQALGNDVLPLLPFQSTLITIIQAMLALLPSIAAVVGLSAATTAAPTMPAADARVVLRAAARS